MRKVPIFHMASMARSGETLVQRHMQAHSQVLVTHNLNKEDAADEQKLFSYLKRSPGLSIPSGSRRLRNFETKGKSVLFLKQGVWEHPFPFRGFILARNPLSIFASLWTYDLREMGGTPEENWKYNEERFVRWLRDIDPLLIPGFRSLEPEHQFALFYNRRMGALLETGLPNIYYEEFVADPEKQLREICRIMDVPFEASILTAHSKYSEKEVGHGQIEMARPIDRSSLDKYKKLLTDNQVNKIWDLTQEVASVYGYSFDGRGIVLEAKHFRGDPISRNYKFAGVKNCLRAAACELSAQCIRKWNFRNALLCRKLNF